MEGGIKSFTQLVAWQESHRLAVRIYKITKGFPNEEIFGLTSQMRRCAVSISSNIAEGFSRQSRKEKVQFYHTSLGSVTELQNQLLIAKDISYLKESEFYPFAELTIRVNKLVNGLIKSAESRKAILNT